MLFDLLGDRVSRGVSDTLEFLFNALREMVVVGDHHHLVVVVHVAEDKLQVLLLARHDLLTHLQGLLR